MSFKKWFNEDEHDFFNFPEEAMEAAWNAAQKDETDIGVLLSALKRGYDVRLSCVHKRTENKAGIRGWYVRFTWEVFGTSGQVCHWEGFETAEECISDFAANFKDSFECRPNLGQ